MPNEDIGKKLYEAISQAETGGLSNRWIRNLYSHDSSAYGPAQLTYSLANGYIKNHANLFTKEELDYLQRFVEQGKKFINYSKGRIKDKKYALGGEGDLGAEKEMYEKVAKKMLTDHYEKTGEDPNKVWKLWRFGPKGGTDPRYEEAFNNALLGIKDNNRPSKDEIKGEYTGIIRDNLPKVDTKEIIKNLNSKMSTFSKEDKSLLQSSLEKVSNERRRAISEYDKMAHVIKKDLFKEGQLPVFDPEGSDYDYLSAEKYDLQPDESGHWPSRVPETGQILKGAQHPTFDKTLEGESKVGNLVKKEADGKYYSNEFAEGGALDPEPPKKKSLLNVYTYNPQVEDKAKKENVPYAEREPGKHYDITFATEYERGKGVLQNMYEKVNHIPIYEANKIQDIIRANKGGDAMIMDHSGDVIGGSQLKSIRNALMDSQVENCYMGTCHGEAYNKELSGEGFETNMYYAPKDMKWEGFNPGKKGVDAIFPKGYVQYKGGKKVNNLKYGGPLQPNGWKSSFSRPEDLKAQDNTLKKK